MQRKDATTLLRRVVELVRSARPDEAASLLQQGMQHFPEDPRFPTEMAGVFYLRGDLRSAKQWLHKARDMGSSDSYVAEFLGTLYLLEGNIEAALALWNPIGLPRISNKPFRMGLEDVIQVRLAELAAPFGAEAVLSTRAYLRASRVVSLLGVCGNVDPVNAVSGFPMELLASANGEYEISLHCMEKLGFGDSWPSSALMLARGVGYQAVHLGHPNLGKRAIALQAMLRWDARKRRAWISTSAPLVGRPNWRLEFFGDARHEYWRAIPSGSESTQQNFLHRRAEAGASVSAVLGSRALWRNSMSVSNRSFTRVALTPQTNASSFKDRLNGGSSLRYGHQIHADLLRLPMKRFFVSASGDFSVERYMGLKRTIGRQQFGIDNTWYPRSVDEDGRVSLRIHGGVSQGRLPLTELFSIGIERDGSVPLRGHVGTRSGWKGSALYGDRYLVTNLAVAKSLLRLGVVNLKLVPFLDAGWVRDPDGLYGARKVRFDAGLQLVAATAGGTELHLSYAWDLRRQRASFYGWSEPFP